MNQFDAFILMGGRSSRLGRDKALVKLGGETLAERAARITATALPAAPLTMVAGNSLQFAIGAITSDLPFIFDLHEGRGPLGGIHAALSYARTPRIFILACDYPFVSAQLIRLLAARVNDESNVVVPEQRDGRIQPLCALYKVTAARPIVDAILERPRVPPPMHEVVAELNPAIITFHEYSHLENADNFFVNINTPEDLAHARAEDGKLSGEK
jgi:molybdenum cofactor guanylyltransferase